MGRYAAHSRKHIWRTLLSIVGAAALLCCAYILYLDWLVTHQFEGRRWTLPAQVYAAPLELYAGLQLSPLELEHELQRCSPAPGALRG